MTVSDDLATLRDHERAMWGAWHSAEERRESTRAFDAALGRVEAEIARLEREQEDHDIVERHNRERAEAAEAEAARLRDGLRLYGSHAKDCEVMRGPWLGREGLGGECSCGYRALLAEDGAAGHADDCPTLTGTGADRCTCGFIRPEVGAA